METPNSIIILAGPVGAGKTTVAKHLVALLPGPVAYIEGDTFWHYIAKGIDDFSTFENFKMVMRSMTLASMSYARAGYRVVLDFRMPPWYMKAILRILQVRKIPVEYVVLRPGFEVCVERTANRCEGIVEDYNNYKNLYYSFDKAQRFIIHDNTSHESVIAQHIMEGLDEGMFRLLNAEELE